MAGFVACIVAFGFPKFIELKVYFWENFKFMSYIMFLMYSVFLLSLFNTLTIMSILLKPV